MGGTPMSEALRNDVDAELPEVRVHCNGRLDTQGSSYSALSWSAPLKVSPGFSSGNDSIIRRASRSALRWSSAMGQACVSGDAGTKTTTSIPSGRKTPFSKTTTPLCTRPRMTMEPLLAKRWEESRTREKLPPLWRVISVSMRHQYPGAIVGCSVAGTFSRGQVSKSYTSQTPT